MRRGFRPPRLPRREVVAVARVAIITIVAGVSVLSGSVPRRVPPMRPQ